MLSFSSQSYNVRANSDLRDRRVQFSQFTDEGSEAHKG